VRDLEETLRCMCENQVNCLVGVPTQVLALARFQQSHQKTFPLRMKSVLLSTDYVPEAIASTIESAWSCVVFNHYGMTEMGLGGGVFCEGNYGYHLREADMYFEIVDPVTGQPLPDGETGEVVFTTLTRQGMPLIRYRTGDRSRFLPGTCPCGSELKSLEKISGRIRHEFEIGGKPCRISDLDEVLFPIPGLINYRLTISGEPGTEAFHFTLYFLEKPENCMENELTDRLNSIGFGNGGAGISYEIITGFPEELSSMAKRKIRFEKTK